VTDPLVNGPSADELHALSDSIGTLSMSVKQLTNRIVVSERRTVILATSLILDILLTAAITFLGWHVQSVSSCQAEANDAFRAALAQRTDASAKERAAQRQLFNVVLNPASSPADRLKASQNYYAGLIAADAQRNEHPLPTSNCA
jgi:hypothetical protein